MSVIKYIFMLYVSYKKNKRKIFKLQELLFTKAFSFKRNFYNFST